MTANQIAYQANKIKEEEARIKSREAKIKQQEANVNAMKYFNDLTKTIYEYGDVYVPDYMYGSNKKTDKKFQLQGGFNRAKSEYPGMMLYRDAINIVKGLFGAAGNAL